MQLVEREFQATQPLKKGTDVSGTLVDRPSGEALYPAPRTSYQMIGALIRVESSVALIMPALYGAVLAWWETGRVDWLAFPFTLLGLLTTVWGFHTLHDYLDYKRSAGYNARLVRSPAFTGYGLLARGIVEPGVAKGLGGIFLAISFVCTLWLTLLAGWPVVFFNGLSFLIAVALLLLPARYGYRGWGLGEMGLFLSLGFLPVVGSYYFHAHTLTMLPVYVGIPAGMFTTLVHFNYNAIHHRRDWLIRKRTLTVNLGLTRALDVAASFNLLAYIAILLIVSLSPLPLLALISLGPLPVALGIFAQIRRDRLSLRDCVQLYRTALHTSTMTGFLFACALLIDRLV